MTEQTSIPGTEKRKRRSPRSETDKLIERLAQVNQEMTVGQLVETLKVGKHLGLLK